MRVPHRSRILVVDDAHLNRRLVQEMLSPDGHDIVHAADGVEALELVAGGGIDLVLLDVMTPALDGIEVCRRLRGELGQPLLPVIVISALTDAATRTRAKAAGADDFLTKPIHEDELLARVRNLLLLREYYALAQRRREHAEAEARRWHLASGVASALAGALDWPSVADALRRQLKAEFDADIVVMFHVRHGGLEEVPIRTERRSDGTPFQQILDASGLSELVAIPVSVGGGDVSSVFCVGRARPFTPVEIELLDNLTPHLANAVAAVESHESTIRQLEQSEERHRILFDASPLPIWVFDPRSLRILAVNDAMATTLGYSRDELCAMRVSDLKPPEDLPQLLHGMDGVVSGKRRQVGVMKYLRKDRRCVELDITSQTTMLAGSLAVLALGVDVTHSRRIEEQLRQSQKMDAIGQLAGGVAHDFNNILAAILGFTELALAEIGAGHPAAADLEEIDAAAHRAASLTKQLLAVSRQQRREVAPVALNSVVTNLEQMLARIVGEDVAMSSVLSPGLGVIEADVGQLEQVLMNLVVNARDAMPNGGRVTIGTSNSTIDDTSASLLGVRPGRYVTLAVTDTGVGMDARTRARVFEPFFTTKEVGKGTGLGLSTVFGIVKQSGGAIAIDSEVGRGSTFRIYLPRADAASVEDGGGARRRRGVVRATNHRVLVVEDDDRLRAVIKRQLVASGYELVEASNAAMAIEVLETTPGPIDLLLTDLVMPGIDGHALARQVLARKPNAKVLFMSGYTEHAAVKTATCTSRDQFIQKPFTSDGLSSAIRRALET